MKDGPLNPWDRQPGESVKAFERFRMYLEMGDGRSSQRVSKMCSKSWTLITRLCARHGWVDRVKAYDGHIAQIRSIELEKAERESAAKWAERREKRREEEYAISQALIARAAKMLAKDDLECSPAAMIDVGVKIGRLALELATEAKELRGPNGTPLIPPPLPISEERFMAFLARYAPKRIANDYPNGHSSTTQLLLPADSGSRGN